MPVQAVAKECRQGALFRHPPMHGQRRAVMPELAVVIVFDDQRAGTGRAVRLALSC